MIRWQDQQDWFFALAAPSKGLGRGDANGGRSVARDRLQKNRGGRDTDGLELLRHHEAVFVVAHHNRSHRTIEERQPLNSRLQRGILTQQTDQLFGMVFARQRPQSAAGTSREDNGYYARIHFPYGTRSFHQVSMGILLEPVQWRRPSHRAPRSSCTTSNSTTAMVRPMQSKGCPPAP